MALGTLLGGWRIVRTMGSKITRLSPMQGFCAETGVARRIVIAWVVSIPMAGLIGALAHGGGGALVK
jgi:PiT family inorganic phosphate transporter